MFRTKNGTAPGYMPLLMAVLLGISCNFGIAPEGIFLVYKSKEGYDKMMVHYNQCLSKWTIPYREIDIDTSWGKTHVIKSGLDNKNPLVFLHGAGSNAASACLPGLARDHAVYNIDIIGEPGRSVPRRIPGRPEEAASWLDEVFTGLKIHRANIIGMSYGGFIGQWFLDCYPDRVNRLVMIHYTYTDQGRPVLPLARLKYYAFKNDSAAIHAMVEYLNAEPVDRSYIVLFEGALHDANAYCRDARANPFQFVPAERVKKVKAPVLIILGEKDPLFDAQKALDFCRGIRNPHIRFEMIPGMGHLPFKHLDQVLGISMDFLNQEGAAVSSK